MLLKEYGNENGKRIVLIHGTGMCWQMFGEVIDILKEDHRVIAVSVPGHDPEKNDTFTSVEVISTLIENELIEHGYRDIDIMYGLSMGGAFVLRILADDRLRVRQAVIDGGITPYELPYALTRAILVKDYLLTILAKNSRKALETAFSPEDYTEEKVSAMHRVLKHMSRRTIWRVYRSTDNYSMPEEFPRLDTVIEYWYGEKEKEERKPDIAYMKKHIPGVIFREIPAMRHGQYVMTETERFCEDLTGDETVKDRNERAFLKPDYKNWVPKGMITALSAGTAVFGILCAVSAVSGKNRASRIVRNVSALGTAVCGGMAAWSVYAHKQFSYEGKRRLSADIIEGTAAYAHMPEGGIGLDVGCGSGALTIACAKRNPEAEMVGLDRWGAEYASFSRKLCQRNARAEGTDNVRFERGDAVSLPYADETFDLVTSNYVYHNISGVNKQKLLRESLRVLKKGGTFAIHDIMSPMRYGNMKKFVRELKSEGYEDVQLIPTDHGKFMTEKEAAVMLLTGSALLTGKK